MTKAIKIVMLVLSFGIGVFSYGADKLAVAQPVAKNAVTAGEIEMLWSILESCIDSEQYQLVSRAALQQIMTEIGLTDSSGLVNMNSKQKAQLGKLEGVKYILVCELGKFGSRLNCTMRIVDGTTGEIDSKRTANLRVKDLDELADKIEYTIDKLLSDGKILPESALLTLDMKIAPVPAYLANEFNSRLESALLDNGIPLQNLQSVSKILKDNRIGNLYELEPKMFRQIGELLEVQYLIQCRITRFDVVSTTYHVAETGASGKRTIGYLDGNVRVVSAQDGKVMGSVNFEHQLNFRDLGYQTTKDWMAEDYGKYLIKTVMNDQIVPKLLKTQAYRSEEAQAQAK